MSSTIRINILREEFSRLGYTYEPILIQGLEYTKFISADGMVWLYKDANGRLPFPYVAASDILNNKIVAADYAYRKNVRVPRIVRVKKDHRTLGEYRQMLDVDSRAGIVIKPTDSTLSQGVTANVQTDNQLRDAIIKAREYSSDIIAQERVEGDEYRFVYVGTTLRAIIQKSKLAVIGDGLSTIEELIIQENSARLGLTDLRVKYPQVSLDFLRMQGVVLDEVLSDGVRKLLNDSTTLEDGASFYEVTESVHSSYIDIANKLAGDFGGGYLAVDIIIKDHMTAAESGNYAFLEFNDIPAPTFFYACRNKPEVPVMRELVRYIDESLRRTKDFK